MGTRFGYYGQPDKQGSNWYEVFRSMLLDTYYDAGRMDIEIVVPKETLLKLLERDREAFEQITEPKLVHWDIWAGNVFVEGDKVTGLIDFERCLWADELLEVGFRSYGYEKGFYDGYGLTSLNPEQLIRAGWYDIYFFLIICLESDYRMYDDKGVYHWGSNMLLECFRNQECRKNK